MSTAPFAQARVEALLRTQAKCTAIGLIKHRARSYLLQSAKAEVLVPGLSGATPEEIIAIAKQMLTAEADTQRRWFGFGGEVPVSNAKGLLLYGRVLRARRDCVPGPVNAQIQLKKRQCQAVVP